MNVIANLPVELCHEFLLYLKGADVIRTLDIFRLSKTITDCHYFWRSKLKIDEIRPLNRYHESENYLDFQKKFQCASQAYYTYREKVRQIWLTKSWKDAVEHLEGSYRFDTSIIYADARIIVQCLQSKCRILNTTTNKVIAKFKLHSNIDHEVWVWNIEKRKVAWTRTFLKDNCIIGANDNIIGTYARGETQIHLIEISTGITKSIFQIPGQISEAYLCKKYLVTILDELAFVSVWDVDSQDLKYSIDTFPPQVILETDIMIESHESAWFSVFDTSSGFGRVFNLSDGNAIEVGCLDLSFFNNKSKLVVWDSKVIFFDDTNYLEVKDCVTMKCLLRRKYKVGLKAVGANNNFIVIATSRDIRILDSKTYSELRKFSLDAIAYWRESEHIDFKVFESKLYVSYYYRTGDCSFRIRNVFTLNFNAPL